MTHPLEELVTATDRAADGLWDADAQAVVKAGGVLLALHPDVARCALALAEGLRVPEGWTVRMDPEGDPTIAVEPSYPGEGMGVVRWDEHHEQWRLVDPSPHRFERFHPTAQEAVDAAVRALGGQP